MNAILKYQWLEHEEYYYPMVQIRFAHIPDLELFVFTKTHKNDNLFTKESWLSGALSQYDSDIFSMVQINHPSDNHIFLIEMDDYEGSASFIPLKRWDSISKLVHGYDEYLPTKSGMEWESIINGKMEYIFLSYRKSETIGHNDDLNGVVYSYLDLMGNPIYIHSRFKHSSESERILWDQWLNNCLEAKNHIKQFPNDLKIDQFHHDSEFLCKFI